ncbi:MAG: Rv0909 family putative TA system antitoxin, partial [Actinomycetota bacterium]
MGLLSSRNIRKAKELLDKNRHKAGDIVGKAGQQLDKVSKGKTSNLTSKATEAANKFADGATTRHDFGEASGDHDGMPSSSGGGSAADAHPAGG